MKSLGYTVGIVAMLLLVAACGRWVNDDLATCPRGIVLQLYSQTECQKDSTYPEAIKAVTLFAFDKRGTLVAMQEEKELKLTKETRLLLPIPHEGAYKVVAWSGFTGELFERVAPKVGETKIGDLYASLQKEADLAQQVAYLGTTERDAIFTPLREGESAQYVEAAINMREETNRIQIVIEGLRDPENLELQVRSANTSYLHDASLRVGGLLHSYPLAITRTANSYDKADTPPASTSQYNGKVSATLTTLRMESGRQSELLITSKATGEVLFQKDLFGLLHVAQEKSGGLVNTHCQNDFTIYLREHHCPICSDGYELLLIRINNWGVHSFDIGF